MAGLNAVPDDAREAATALGYSPDRRVGPGRPAARRCRTSSPGCASPRPTVIGLVTVTALIGLGGLGQQITYGFNIGYNTPIIVGLVLSIALAAVADLLLVGAQRLVVPWTRSRRAGAGAARPDMSFLAHVFGWFTTSANWTGSQGIPRPVLAPAEALGGRRPDRARRWAAGSGSSSGTPGGGAWSRSTPPTRSGPCRRWPS